MSDPQFIEFTGKKLMKDEKPKLYQCFTCKEKGFRYAKFFGSDGKILTTDGKEPYFDMKRKPMSNSGWLVDPNTKKMHECKEKPTLNDLSVSYIDNTPKTPQSNINYEVAVKRTDLLTPQAKDFDSLLLKNGEEEAYHIAKLVIAHLRGVRRACKEEGIEDGPVSGMVFNKTGDRLRRVHEPD